MTVTTTVVLAMLDAAAASAATVMATMTIDDDARDDRADFYVACHVYDAGNGDNDHQAVTAVGDTATMIRYQTPTTATQCG